MRDRFRAAGIESAERDARLLAEHALALTPLELVNREREAADPAALAALEVLAQRRLGGEPVARILGEKEFYGRPFGLNAGALVPRPETELLVERGLALVAEHDRPRLLDLGTGSGCIAITLLAERPEANAIAVDLAADAVAMARQNAARHGVEQRLSVRQGSWFEPLELGESFDLVVSNPPYIVRAVIDSLAVEVRQHDPLLALDGGPDGLEAYRRIIGSVRRWLRPGGAVALEIGHDQGEAVARLFAAAGFSGASVEKDLNGLDRIVFAYHS